MGGLGRNVFFGGGGGWSQRGEHRLTMPHDPYPRALGAVSLQQVQSAAVEHALLDRVLFSRCPHGELSELIRQDESADRRADAEEECGVCEY